MQTKAFSFCCRDYSVNALAHLYPDGLLKEIEIQAIWKNKKDLLKIYLHDAECEWPTYVRAWMKQLINEMKIEGGYRIQRILTDASALYYEHDFL